MPSAPADAGSTRSVANQPRGSTSPGQGHSRDRREGEVGGSAQTRLEHPAHPDGETEGDRPLLDATRRGPTADASRLQAEHLTRADRDGGLEAAERRDGLVEAHGRVQPPRQISMGHQVVGRKWLLDARELELVELDQLASMGGVGRIEGAVGVDLEGQRVGRVNPTHGRDCHSPSGRDLEPDPRGTGGHSGRDFPEQRVGIVVHPHCRAGRNRGGGRAQPARQALIRGAQLGIEQRQLQRGAGHRVAAHLGAEPLTCRERVGSGFEPENEVVAEHERSTGCELRRVRRLRLGHALRPPLRISRQHVHEQHVAVAAFSQRCSHGSEQRQSHGDQLDRLEHDRLQRRGFPHAGHRDTASFVREPHVVPPTHERTSGR